MIKQKKPIYSSRSPDWKFFSFDFDYGRIDSVDIRFSFTFVCGGYYGDIALDDVIITGCHDVDISDSEHMSDVQKMADFANQNDFPDKCETELSNSMTCNFDSENLCGWRGENVQFGRGETFTSNTGPNEAHSPDNYIYLESSNADKAKIFSPKIPKHTEICLKFYYYMHGIGWLPRGNLRSRVRVDLK